MSAYPVTKAPKKVVIEYRDGPWNGLYREVLERFLPNQRPPQFKLIGDPAMAWDGPGITDGGNYWFFGTSTSPTKGVRRLLAYQGDE